MKNSHHSFHPSICLLCVVLFTANSHASELVYQPVNPNFGGNPLNGSQLMNNAQAQDRHEAPKRSTSRSTSALDRLTSSLESRLLSQLMADLGEGNTGTLSTDDFMVVATEDIDGALTITITDQATGETTEIQVDGLIPDTP